MVVSVADEDVERGGISPRCSGRSGKYSATVGSPRTADTQLKQPVTRTLNSDPRLARR